MRLYFLISFIFIFHFEKLQAQQVFDKTEAMNMVAICNYWLNGKIDNVDSTYIDSTYTLKFESKPTSLDNRWQLWVNKDRFGVINLRGTTRKNISWYENFYAAMIPAQGVMTLPGGQIVDYKFAEDKKASVHAGWALSIEMMLNGIINAIDSLNKQRIYTIYITGHSQGGALAHLLRAAFQYLPDSVLSSKNTYKVYSFASPKPGNRFFAYDYAQYTNFPVATSFTVINKADWVPQVPFSVQSPDNMVEKNPFVSLENNDFDIPFIKRMVIKHIYFKMKHPVTRSQKRFEKYLGRKMKKQIENTTGDFELPGYSNDFSYFPVGVQIILSAWDGNTNDKVLKVFWQHIPAHYYYLIKEQL